MERNFYLPMRLGMFGEGEADGASDGGAQAGGMASAGAEGQDGGFFARMREFFAREQGGAQVTGVPAEQEGGADGHGDGSASPPPALSTEDVRKLISDAFTDFSAQQAEAEKLAKMTADERAAHERAAHEQAVAGRLAEVTRRELRIEAHKALTEKGLPAELLDALRYDDAESCKASMAAVEAAFRAAVEAGVNGRLRGSGLPKGASGAVGGALTMAQVKGMSREEIMANMGEVEKALAAQRP